MKKEKKKLTKEEGIMWSFKRILAAGIVILVLGIILMPDMSDAAIRKEASKSWSGSSSSIRKAKEEQQGFALVVTFLGVGTIATAFAYKIIKMNKLQDEKKMSGRDNLSKIGELKKLLDDGAITKEEFEEKKRELLKES